MQYRRVCLEALGYVLPDEVWSSDGIERQLARLYERLNLPEGRLELMTGIAERRVWPPETLPGAISIESGRRALEAAEIDTSRIGALVHGSVCRDHLEPATACRVHHGLGLPAEALAYDVSNACLGLLNGALQVANMIELGQIEAGLVVGTESSRQLLETTIDWLNRQTSLSRRDIKQAVASLTIGSGSCAILLVDQRISRTGHRLVAACARSESQYHRLCHSGRDEAMDGGAQPLMWTDSEQLLQQGVALGEATFRDFLRETGWSHDELDRVVCHQVGSAHQKRLLETLHIDRARDFITYPWLGNTGSVALPITLAVACERGHIGPGHRVGLFGIGSGINCLMLGCHGTSGPRVGGNP